MGRYLIPANTKKGTLIFGLFREGDLIIFGIGIGITFITVSYTHLTLPTTSRV